ncbi:MAG: hypothetical protein ACP5C4_03710 [Methanomicrobiales archaeon]
MTVVMRKIRIPAMLTNLIHGAVEGIDGAIYADLGACPHCGGTITSHDYRKKRFAVLVEDGEDRIVHVHVRRFHCRQCARLLYAPAPFYPDTRLGSPIVDLCIALGRRMPASRAARVMQSMGLRVDRGSILNYARCDIGTIPVMDVFGIPLPISLVRFAVDGLTGEGMSIEGAELFGAGGLPPAYRAPLSSPGLLYPGYQRNTQHEEEERQPDHPESSRQRH